MKFPSAIFLVTALCGATALYARADKVPAAPAPNLAAPAETPVEPAKPKRRAATPGKRIQTITTDIFHRRFSFLTGSTFDYAPLFSAALSSTPFTAASAPSSIVLDTFDADSASGSVISSTSWSGQVTQNPTSITIAGTAGNDNGWGVTSLNLDASGLGFINITAQRDAGHPGGSLFFQFEDRSLNTAVFSIDTSLFALSSPTTLSIPVGNWGGSEFDSTAIFGWSLGGGSIGNADFRMTLHNLELSASAIPEPETYAAFLGLAALAFTLHRRRR